MKRLISGGYLRNAMNIKDTETNATQPWAGLEPKEAYLRGLLDMSHNQLSALSAALGKSDLRLEDINLGLLGNAADDLISKSKN